LDDNDSFEDAERAEFWEKVKKELLKNTGDPNIHETDVTPYDMVKETDILKFFLEEIDSTLEIYEPGRVENKPDVMKQIAEIMKKREAMVAAHRQQQSQQQVSIQELIQNYQKTINDQNNIIQEIMKENRDLKAKADYLDNKIKQLISDRITDLKKLKSQESKV
jgi:hypothetical protein